MPVIKGKALWAKVFTPDTKFGPKYTIDLIISKKDYDALGKITTNGLKINEQGEHVAKFKTAAVWKDGKPKDSPRVVGPDGKAPFTQDIGNGSVVNVAYEPYEYKAYGGGVTLTLSGVQVLEHVVYDGGEGGGGDMFSPVEGAEEPVSDNPFA